MLLLVLPFFLSACSVLGPSPSSSSQVNSAKSLDQRIFTAQEVATAFGQVMNQSDPTLQAPGTAEPTTLVIPSVCGGAVDVIAMLQGLGNGWQEVTASDTGVLFKVFDKPASAAALADRLDVLSSSTCAAVQVNEYRLDVSASSKMKPLVQQGRSWGLRLTSNGSPAEFGIWQGGNLVVATGQLPESTSTPSATADGAILNLILTKLGIS
jgi:hypothetical protein